MKKTSYVAVCAILLMFSLGLHANSEEPQNAYDFNFGAKLGYMIPLGEAMRDIYGGGLVFGVDAIVWHHTGIGGGLSIERFGASGYPYTYGNVDPDDADCSISIVPISLSGMYRIKQTSIPFEPYFGLGGGLYFVSEKLEVTYGGNTSSASGSDAAIGFHGLAGLKYRFMIVELKYTTASIKSDAAHGSANIGGINILAGVRF